MATSARLDELKKKFDENPRRYFAPLANEYRKLGDLTQAIALCRAHLPNQPGHISGHIVLAQALYEARELGESRQIFEQALDLDPENLIALRYLGDIAREQGEPQQARTWYERVLDADPRNEEISQLLNELALATPVQTDAADATPSYSESFAQPPADEVLVAEADQYAAEVAGYEVSEPASLEASGFTTNSIEGSYEGPTVATVVDSSWPTPTTPHLVEEFPEPDQILSEPSDVPSISEAPAFASLQFEETRSDDATDFFFTEDSESPTVLGELEAVAEPSFDDWFATETRPQAPPVVTPAVAELMVEETSELERPTATLEASPFAPVHPTPSSSLPTPPFLAAVSDTSESPVEAYQASASHEPAADEGDDSWFSLPSHSTSSPHSFAPAQESEREADDEEFDEQVVAAVPSEADVPTLEVDIIVPDDEASQEASVTHAGSSVDAPAFEFETQDGFASPAASFDSSAPEAEADFVVEYGEFQSAVDDAIPFIASAISVPLSEAGTFGRAADDSTADLSATEEEQEEATSPAGWDTPVADSVLPPTDALDQAQQPVEAGFEQPFEPQYEPPYEAQYEAQEEPPFEAELETQYEADTAIVGQSPAFVTETMAELYLQQGFTEEALAIYRQLLDQQPGDEALRDRVAALERGSSSPVVEGIVPRDAVDRAGQSVRSFFAHFARRQPRRRVDVAPDRGADVGRETAQAPSEFDGRLMGAATREEALTVPDVPDNPAPTSLSQLFSSSAVSNADEKAASTLASAFGGDSAATPRAGGVVGGSERELSLEHLFRDVPARSSGAVTLDEFYEGSSPGEGSPSPSGGAGEGHDADIEQFTAWLEGLKKK